MFSAEIEDLTEFSPQSVDPPDLSKCAGRVLETLAPAAALREVELDLSPSPGEGLPGVVAEENRLERVLYNLVQNALRYAPPGSRVVVAVQTEGPRVRVSVQDDGPGVAAALRPQLFRKLIQGEGRKGKAGLGLYFCRIMVERWGGEIGYSSREPSGSVFWFKLDSRQRQAPDSTDS